MAKIFHRFYNNPDIGKFNNRPAVLVWDNTSVSLPSGSTITIDGASITRGTRVIFTNLSDTSLNNRVYELVVVDNSLHWLVQKDLQRFNSEPMDGDVIYILQGTDNAQKLLAYSSESSTWEVQRVDLDWSDDIGRDGDRPPRANISWGSYKITNLADGANLADAVNFDQLSSVSSSAILRDNTQPPTTDISWDSNKLTDLDDGTDPNDAINKSQLTSHESDTTAIHGIVDTSDLALQSGALSQFSSRLHSDLTDIGTNAHSQIDSHISDSSIHYSESSISHLNIQDIGSNSHTAIDSHILASTSVHGIVDTSDLTLKSNYLTRTLNVSKGGNDSNSGSSLDPFLTIGAAITAAKSLSPLPSYTNPVNIIVSPGEYSEQVLLDYHGINLYGFGQGVTRIQYAGTALRIEDNSTDPEPWDLKVVGVSINSSTSDYSVTITGIAGSSLGGNELQFKDCRFEGSNSIHANIVNYIDYQNTYIMGSQLYEQVSGIYCEDSESSGSITVDWDNAGTKPSSTSHYGINFVRHLPRGSITLLNSGLVGEDVRPRPYALLPKAEVADIGKILKVTGAETAEWSATSAVVTSFNTRTGAVTSSSNDYTWAQIDKTVSDLADLTTKSHTSLTDKGTNTHATIDSHLSSTSNPHTVTAAQASAIALGGTTTPTADIPLGNFDLYDLTEVRSWTAIAAAAAVNGSLFIDTADDEIKWKDTSGTVHNLVGGGGVEADPLSFHLNADNFQDFTPIVGDDATYDIGSSSARWKDAYFSGSVNVGATTTIADGSISQSGANPLLFNINSSEVARFGSSGNFKLNDTDILWTTDGGGDIGAASDTRPNNVYAKTSMQIAAQNFTDSDIANYNTAYGWGDHAGLYEPINANIQTHISSTSNPHSVSASQVGNGTAQWNADKLRGISITAPVSGDDAEFLRYNYNGGAPTLTWEAAGGGGDLWSDAVTSDILPTGNDATYDLGSPGARFKDAFLSNELATPAVRGSTASAGSLLLESTSNATKGYVEVSDGSMILVGPDAKSYANMLTTLYGAPIPSLAQGIFASGSGAVYPACVMLSTFNNSSQYNFLSFIRGGGTVGSPSNISSGESLGETNWNVQIDAVNPPKVVGKLVCITKENTGTGYANKIRLTCSDSAGLETYIFEGDAAEFKSYQNLTFDSACNIGNASADRPVNVYASSSFDVDGKTTITSEYMDMQEWGSPSDPAANKGRLYVADDGGTTKLYFRDNGSNITDLTADNDEAIWNADELQGNPISNVSLGAGQDGYLLSWVNASNEAQWTAPAVWGDVSSSAVVADNRIVRGDGGSKNVQDSALSLADTTGDLVNTDTTSAWSISKASVSSGAGNDITIQAGNTTDTAAVLGGNLNLKSGTTGYAGALASSSVNIYAATTSGLSRLMMSCRGYDIISGANSTTTTFYDGGSTTKGLTIKQIANAPEIGYRSGTTFTSNFTIGPGYTLASQTIYGGGSIDIGGANLYAFRNAYFEGAYYAGADNCPDGDRLEISNQSIKQDDTVLNAAGKKLTIEAGDAEGTDTNNYDGGDIDITPGAAANSGTDGNVNITRGNIEMAGTQVLTTQQAAVASVATADADATYGIEERDLINELKVQVNDLLGKLRAHGIIAT